MEYPRDAYTSSGELWWNLRSWPDKRVKFGAATRMAAWLSFNAQIGEFLTMRQLRQSLGTGKRANEDEHFNRRFRSLRKYGWIVHSSRDDGKLAPHEYRLVRVGAPIWLGKSKYGRKQV